MTIREMDREVEREQQLEALGDAVAQTIPTPAPGAAGLLPDEVARVLMRPRRQLRVVWKLGPVLALGAAAAVFAVFRAQPLRYEIGRAHV